MNRNDIVKELLKIIPEEKLAHKITIEIFEIMKNALKNGDTVLISSFGSFYPLTKEPALRRNPKTNEKVMTGLRKKVRFKPSKQLLDFI